MQGSSALGAGPAGAAAGCRLTPGARCATRCAPGGEQWRVRRKAVGPALHRAYLEAMLDRVFGPSALHLAQKLEVGGWLGDLGLRGWGGGAVAWECLGSALQPQDCAAGGWLSRCSCNQAVLGLLAAAAAGGGERRAD